MKKFLKQFSQILGTPAVMAVALAAHSAPAPKQTNSAPAEVVVHKSVFEDDLKSGKDPFFPKSTRRAPKTVAPDTKAVAPVIQLALKGISGPASRRFALINNQPLAAGEEGYVRVPGGQIKVHCWEIRDDSVVVSVEGETEKRELRLREGL